MTRTITWCVSAISEEKHDKSIWRNWRIYTIFSFSLLHHIDSLINKLAHRIFVSGSLWPKSRRWHRASIQLDCVWLWRCAFYWYLPAIAFHFYHRRHRRRHHHRRQQPHWNIRVRSICQMIDFIRCKWTTIRSAWICMRTAGTVANTIKLCIHIIQSNDPNIIIENTVAAIIIIIIWINWMPNRQQRWPQTTM